MAQAAVSQVRYLLFEDVYVRHADDNVLQKANSDENEINPAVRDMHNWIAANIPEGEKIITTEHYASQLAFLNGMQHGWTVLQMDYCANFSEGTCHLDKVVAFELDKNCGGPTLPFTSLIGQMERSGAKYLLTTQEKHVRYPANLAWAPYLESSGAFETAYSSYLPGAPTTERSYGLVLLRWTGRDPMPAPTLMKPRTVKNLIRCEKKAWGERHAERIRKDFPDGIEVIGSQSEVEPARRAIEKIYGTR